MGISKDIPSPNGPRVLEGAYASITNLAADFKAGIGTIRVEVWESQMAHVLGYDPIPALARTYQAPVAPFKDSKSGDQTSDGLYAFLKSVPEWAGAVDAIAPSQPEEGRLELTRIDPMPRVHAKYIFKSPPKQGEGTIERWVSFVPDDKPQEAVLVKVLPDAQFAETELFANYRVKSYSQDIDQAGNGSVPSESTPGITTQDLVDVTAPSQPEEGTLELTVIEEPAPAPE